MAMDPKTSLNKILQSSPFSKSELHKRLLTYLVDCYQKNKYPAEIDIAMAIFGRDEDFNSTDDTIVRVSIYKLRKKLETYYSKEGKQENIQLTIPKGHYNIEFVKKSAQPDVTIRRTKYIVSALIVVIAILVSVVIRQQVQLSQVLPGQIKNSSPKFQSEIWTNYFDNNLPHNVIVGDFYIFEEYSPKLKRRRRIMDYYINTDKDFYKYKEAAGDLEFNILPIGEIPHHIIFSIQDIAHTFFTFNKKYMVEMSSSFELKKTLRNNIVYLGNFKCLNELDGFLLNKYIKFEYGRPFSGKLHILDEQGEIIKTFDNSIMDMTKDSQTIDYCMVFKTRGPENENYFFFVGSGYIGQLEAVNILCNPDRILEFESEIKKLNGSIPESFLTVMESSGIYLTPYHTEMVYFQSLDE